MIVILLSFLLSLAVASLMFLIMVTFRFGGMLMNVEDNTQKALDIMDDRYYQLSHVFDEAPGIINDDPLVKRFFEQVKAARNDVLVIANLFNKITQVGADSVISNDLREENEIQKDNKKDEAPRQLKK